MNAMSLNANRSRYWLELAGLTAVYFAAGKLGLSLAFLHKSASPVWPPAGIALASLLIMGLRLWPAIFVGAFLVNLTTFGTATTSTLIAVGNTLEALCGAWFMQRLAGGREAFERPGGVFTFILFAGLFSTTISATTGVTSLAVSGFADWTLYGNIWLTWWLGDATGMMIVAPALLLWTSGQSQRWNWEQVRQRVPVLLCVALAGLILFSGILRQGRSNFPLAFVGIPLLLWPAFRFGPREAATATCVISAIAVWGTLRGAGPFVQATENESLLMLQTFMAVNAVVSLLFAAVIAQRKQAEAQLRESEQRLGALFRQASVGLCEKDRAGRYTLVNDKFCEIVGYSRYELLGRSFEEISHSDSLQGEADDFRRLVSGEIDTYSIDKRYVRKSGEPIWVSLTMSALRDASGAFRYGIGSIQDNSERVRAIENELETAARLRAVVDTAVDGIITIDEHGTISTINAAALRLFGYQANEVIGKNIQTLMPEAYRSGHETQLGEYLRSGQRRVIGIGREAEGMRKDGSIFPIELSVSETKLANRRLFTGIIRDITERKHSEDKLHSAVKDRTAELATANERLVQEIQQRSRAEAILAGETQVLELIATGASSDEVLEVVCEVVERNCPAVWCSIRLASDVLSPPSATRTYGNAGLCDLPSEFAEDPLSRRIVEDALDVSALRDWANRARMRAVWTEPIVGSAGQVLGTVVMAHPEPRRPADHEAAAVIAATRVAGIIIEKSRAEARSWKQLAELAHVSRLATMGELASGLAHELNQPLCAIVNYAGACLELINAKQNGTELHLAMEEVAKQAERAGEVIRRLREFVRRREPHRAAVDMNKIVREVVGLTKAEIRQHEVDVKLQLAKRLPFVHADQIQIQQVIVNLVRNAIDAMTDTAAREKRLWMSTRRSGDFIELAVSDSGHGIDEQTREQVFESFFTTKSHGMGMGLSISRSIVEMHDGRIWVTPNDSCGTTFSFALPLARRNGNGS
jgi:PAS domain S-box-containing protein